MAKSTLTASEYTQLIGLFGMAQKQRQALDASKMLVGDIVGDQQAASQAIDRGIKASEFLTQLGIQVDLHGEGAGS